MWSVKDLARTTTRGSLRGKSTKSRDRKVWKAPQRLWDDEKWIVRKEFTRVRSVDAIPKSEDVYRLTAEMKKYLTWCNTCEA
ncbi:NPC1 [Symbiodinium natans]|uniref:NPC1 protein n=1 Tax=Symbiodinium natans TaxID=878477 RepID=A0A812T970_9DINO|nr:NPC1 [Symbiodinium natans]